MKKAIIDATLETFNTLIVPTFVLNSASEKYVRMDIMRNLIKNLLVLELDKSPPIDASLLAYSLFVRLNIIYP